MPQQATEGRIKVIDYNNMRTRMHLQSMALLIAMMTTMQFLPVTAAVDASSLLSRSRQLQNNNNNNNNNVNDVNNYENYAYDLSSYSVRYTKCQYVKTFDDALAAEDGQDSPLAMKHFVLFRLCPTNECSTCDSSTAYGKYVTDVDTYLQYTVEQQQQIFQNYCQNCEEQGCGGENSECYSDCGHECYFYQNLEESRHVDAADYIQCQELVIPEENENGRKLLKQVRKQRRVADEQEEEGEEEVVLYAGPRCRGGAIQIGVFSDENCWDPVENVDIEDLLGMPLDYYFLEHTNRKTTNNKGNVVCLTCEENDKNQNEADARDYDKVNAMCEGLYNAAGKCETPTGINGVFMQVNRKKNQNVNQVENEFLTCGFIDSLLWNSYTEKGNIDYKSRQDVYERQITELQAWSLGALGAFFLSLLTLGYYYNKKIEVVTAKSSLKPDPRATYA